MGNIGGLEIAGLLILALLLFGAKRLPEIGRSMGQGMREFKNSVTGVTKEVDDVRAELESAVSVDSTSTVASREHDTV
jgi:sec-independent protein translocase protein TatA